MQHQNDFQGDFDQQYWRQNKKWPYSTLHKAFYFSPPQFTHQVGENVIFHFTTWLFHGEMWGSGASFDSHWVTQGCSIYTPIRSNFVIYSWQLTPPVFGLWGKTNSPNVERTGSTVSLRQLHRGSKNESLPQHMLFIIQLQITYLYIYEVQQEIEEQATRHGCNNNNNKQYKKTMGNTAGTCKPQGKMILDLCLFVCKPI